MMNFLNNAYCIAQTVTTDKLIFKRLKRTMVLLYIQPLMLAHSSVYNHTRTAHGIYRRKYTQFCCKALLLTYRPSNKFRCKSTRQRLADKKCNKTKCPFDLYTKHVWPLHYFRDLQTNTCGVNHNTGQMNLFQNVVQLICP